MRIGQLSHRGTVRPKNEDRIYSSQKKDLLIIADGMGGHNAGEIASKLAIERSKYYIRTKREKYDDTDDGIKDLIKDSIEYANKYIIMSQKDQSLKGMGTTIIVAYIRNDKVYIGHVGDSRLYLSNNSFAQITTDHSLVQELFDMGSISKEELENYPNKNIITRALGYSEKIEVDTFILKIKKDDTLLLCTDGISNMISDKEMFEVIKISDSPQKCAKLLIDMANENGGKDNISVIIAKKVS